MSTSFLLDFYYGGVPFCKKGTPPYPLFKNFEEGYGGNVYLQEKTIGGQIAIDTRKDI